MRKLIFATFTLICTLASAVLIPLSLTGVLPQTQSLRPHLRKSLRSTDHWGRRNETSLMMPPTR
jgi:hypothetical protein